MIMIRLLRRILIMLVERKNWLVGGNGGEAETEEPFRPGSQTHFCHQDSDWGIFLDQVFITIKPQIGSFFGGGEELIAMN